jgi:hypothetical protein
VAGIGVLNKEIEKLLVPDMDTRALTGFHVTVNVVPEPDAFIRDCIVAVNCKIL